MAARQPRYSKEEFARRGDEIYESQVRQQVEAGNHGKIVAIDIETGAFEAADDSLSAAKQLLKRLPEAKSLEFGSGIVLSINWVFALLRQPYDSWKRECYPRDDRAVSRAWRKSEESGN